MTDWLLCFGDRGEIALLGGRMWQGKTTHLMARK